MRGLQKIWTRLLGTVILLRGLYSVAFSALVLVALMGIVDIREFGPELSSYFASANPMLVVAWLVYALGYCVSGILVLFNKRLTALCVYAGSFAVDITLWLSVHSVRFNSDAAPGWANFADMFFNVFDLAALTILIYRAMVYLPNAATIVRMGHHKH